MSDNDNLERAKRWRQMTNENPAMQVTRTSFLLEDGTVWRWVESNELRCDMAKEGLPHAYAPTMKEAIDLARVWTNPS